MDEYEIIASSVDDGLWIAYGWTTVYVISYLNRYKSVLINVSVYCH